MVKSRKKYDKEFKLMAVELIESHKTVPEVSKDLGISKALLYQWGKYATPINQVGLGRANPDNLVVK